MAPVTYTGPTTQIFPHLSDPEGHGTLVLRPGADYDFGEEGTAGYQEPPGPKWWWADPASDTAQIARAAAALAVLPEPAPGAEPAAETPAAGEAPAAETAPAAPAGEPPEPPADPAAPEVPADAGTEG
jgi:hypothetical protein